MVLPGGLNAPIVSYMILPRGGGREQTVTSAVCCWPQQDSAMGVRGMNKKVRQLPELAV